MLRTCVLSLTMSALCIACNKSVSGRKHAVSCDVCDRWQHRLCGTGISYDDYRAAVRGERDLAFVCLSCTTRIPALEPDEVPVDETLAEPDSFMGQPVAESTVLNEPDQPPHLELSVPLYEVDTIVDEDQPPVLERSVPLAAMTEEVGPPTLELSVPLYEVDTIVDEDQPPVLERSVPLATVTEDVGPPTLELSVPVEEMMDVTFTQPPVLEMSIVHSDDSDDFVPLRDESEMVNETLAAFESYTSVPMADSTVDDPPALDASFDLSHRDIDDTAPIQEQPVDDAAALTETILDDAPVEYSIVEKGSQRGRKLLVSSNGYSYGVKATYKNSVVWRCSVRSTKTNCHATVIQRGETFVHSNTDHIHPADMGKKLKAQVSVKVKQDAADNVFRPAMDIVDDVMLDTVRPNDVVLPKKPLLKRVANRNRAKMRPQEPRDLEFEVNQDFLQCNDFLIADIRVDTQRHFLFATEKQLSLLRSAKRWYMDGTFKVLGDPWKRQGQLFSIHAFIQKDGHSQQFPLAFCIMSRKTTSDYNEVFRALVDKLGDVEVEGFVVDFEAAAWRALQHTFPGISIKGCVFHWNQAVWRHVQQYGLAATYQQRQGLYDYVRQLMALPFLPARHIAETFSHLKTKANTEQLQRLVEYMDRLWFRHPVFEVSSWCVFRQTVRTNNDVEGWHHRLNSKAGMSGLGFYRLVPLLRREAVLMEMALRSGDLQRDRRGGSRRLEARLEDCWTRYMDHEISTTAFLRACGSLYGVRPTGQEPLQDAE